MKNIAVFFHKVDNDGLMSGVIAENYLMPRVDTIDMVPINYGEDFESALANPVSFYEDIYMIDVSDEKFMRNHGKKIIYIDHHKNAMDTMPPVRDRHCIDGVAACRLVFDYLTSGPDYLFHDKGYYVNRENPLEPLCVAILGEYDIWDKNSCVGEKLNFGQDVKYNSVRFLFNATKKILVGDSPDKTLDFDVIEANKNTSVYLTDWSYLKYLITKGEGALDYIKSTIERITPVPFVYDFSRGVYINTSLDPSLVGLSYQLKDDEDFVMVWHLNKGFDNVSASFRSNKIDVSEIARKFGGGGHKSAAACRMSLGLLLDLIKSQF